MKRHTFDIVSFVFGVVFLGLGLTAIFSDEDVTVLEARWIWPVLLVVAGLAIVAFTVRRDSSAETPAESPYDPVD